MPPSDVLGLFYHNRDLNGNQKHLFLDKNFIRFFTTRDKPVGKGRTGEGMYRHVSVAFGAPLVPTRVCTAVTRTLSR